MTDKIGRNIDYMRISLTDRCNLRCKYCMPAEGIEMVEHERVLRYEEILRICRAAVELGVNRFKITGGEPLARKGAADFMKELKAAPGVKCVTLTTNGVQLMENLDALKAAGIDCINISLSSTDGEIYKSVTGFDKADTVMSAIEASCASGIRTKVNTVLLDENKSELLNIAQLSARLPVDVRFIELMPIGRGREFSGPGGDELIGLLTERFSDLHQVDEKRGNGPAVYYAGSELKGRIGLIAANTHKFCSSCNRVRLTSTGILKPCLCYCEGTDLAALIRGGASDGELCEAMKKTIFEKPAAHCFGTPQSISEQHTMNAIGG